MAKRTRIILDTDIGTDVDDAYALFLAASHDAFDLAGVTTVLGDTVVRARVALTLLRLLNHRETPVGAGASVGSTGRAGWWGGWEDSGILPAVVPERTFRSATETILGAIAVDDSPITLIAIGALTNIAEALRVDRAIARRIERIILMGGCVDNLELAGKSLHPCHETNLINDPAAAEFVLTSGVPLRIVPANVSFQAKLFLHDFETIRTGYHPAVRHLVSMTETYRHAFGLAARSWGLGSFYSDTACLLHDPITLATICRPDLLTIETARLRLQVTEEAVTLQRFGSPHFAAELITTLDVRHFSSWVTEHVSRFAS